MGSYVKENNQIPHITEVVKQKFWGRVELVNDEKICWNWKGWVKCQKKPYGVIKIGNINIPAHRLSYYLNFGIDPKELQVLHHCDNPRCVNPTHLFLGTNKDNIDDKVKKGRQAKNQCWNKGVETKFRLWDNKNCNLNKSDFLEAKDIYERGEMTLSELELKYSSSKRAIGKGLRKMGVEIPKHTTVLSEGQVIEIRRSYSLEKKNGVKLAIQYNVHKKTILDIFHRKTWKNI